MQNHSQISIDLLGHRLRSKLLVVLDGVQLVLGHVLLVKVLPSSSKHNIADVVVLVRGNFAAPLNDDLVAGAAVVVFVVHVEVARLGHPVADLVVPVVAADAHRHGFVH